MLKFIKKILGKMIRILYRMVYRMIPCDPKTVLFISFHGRGYSDNPKALHMYMKTNAQFAGYTFVWAIKHHRGKHIDGALVIEYFSIPYFFYLARSKFWIVNCKLPKYVLKKDDQIYVQTWHGTPLKRLAHDIIAPKGATFYRSGMNEDEMKGTYDDDVAKYTYMVSPNAFSTEVFQSAFQIDRRRLIETGYPRNDFLSSVTREQIAKIKQKLHIPLHKKVILYAPTWRDNSFVTTGYTFTLQADFYKWKKVLGDEHIVVFKPHYLIINTCQDDTSLHGFLYTMEANADINDLYVISDMLVTDYSSVFFDYAILYRPIYFYMYDVVEYKEELRGFYLDIEKELPGDIDVQEDSLLAKIASSTFDYERLKQFNARFNYAQSGDCSKKVCDIVFAKE